MIPLNLEAKNESQKIIKAYLEENASQPFANKVNNGTRIEKDGKTLINKKDLDGFWAYATKKAQELKSQYMDNDTVFGWAIHYFEENSFEGTLYNEDGSKYVKPTPKSSQPVHTPSITVKAPPPKPKQITLFDMLTSEPAEESVVEETVQSEEAQEEIIETAQLVKEEIAEPYTLEVDEETGEVLAIKPIQEAPKGTSLYQKYLSFKNQYPAHVVAYRVGDFYEFFGDDAIRLSKFMDLVLTGRDCGLKERVPMVGIPYHASEPYFMKIATKYKLAIVDGDEVELMETEELLFVSEDITEEERNELFEDDLPQKDDGEIDNFEEEYAVVKFFDKDALCNLYELFEYNLDLQ